MAFSCGRPVIVLIRQAGAKRVDRVVAEGCVAYTENIEDPQSATEENIGTTEYTEDAEKSDPNDLGFFSVCSASSVVPRF